jgi:hypothetical protein
MAFPEYRALDWLQRSCLHCTPKRLRFNVAEAKVPRSLSRAQL